MSPLVREYEVPGDDFARAGEASGHIKSMLKELGFAPAMIRRVAITTYEAEINMVIHAGGGHVTATITPDAVKVVFTDHGPQRGARHAGGLVHGAPEHPGARLRRRYGSAQHKKIQR